VTSEQIRSELVEALQLDLIGPSNDHAFARELLPDAPSRWYLSGFLVPSDAPVEQRTDETADDEIDSAGEGDATDDDAPPDRGAARKKFLPSSMGLSVLLDPEVRELEVTVCWGDYHFEGSAEETVNGQSAEAKDVQAEPTSDSGNQSPTDRSEKPKRRRGYRRIPNEVKLPVVLPASGTSGEVFVPGSNGLALFVTSRAIPKIAFGASQLPDGTRSVSLFLVNHRKANERHGYRAFAFQTELRITSAKSFIAHFVWSRMLIILSTSASIA